MLQCQGSSTVSATPMKERGYHWTQAMLNIMSAIPFALPNPTKLTPLSSSPFPPNGCHFSSPTTNLQRGERKGRGGRGEGGRGGGERITSRDSASFCFPPLLCLCSAGIVSAPEYDDDICCPRSESSAWKMSRSMKLASTFNLTMRWSLPWISRCELPNFLVREMISSPTSAFS